jgi:hypothetical protein
LSQVGQALSSTKGREQQRRERIEQRRPVGDVGVGMRPVIVGRHDLPVLPDAENQTRAKDQAGGQQDDLGVRPRGPMAVVILRTS